MRAPDVGAGEGEAVGTFAVGMVDRSTPFSNSFSNSTRTASGPIPKFVSTRGAFRYELRNLRTTSNSMMLVPLLNPKFAIALAARCARTSGPGH